MINLAEDINQQKTKILVRKDQAQNVKRQQLLEELAMKQSPSFMLHKNKQIKINTKIKAEGI